MPETKEEIRRRRILRIVYAVTAAVTVAIGVWLYFYISHRMAVTAAFEQASDDGRVASAHAALELIEADHDPVSRAMALRLRSMLVLAGESDDADAIGSALSSLPSDDYDVARERGVAQTYLALASGDLAVAMETASAIVATHGDHKAEALRARALAAWAVGNVEIASLAAEHAANERPQAPRHVALHAELLARGGDTDAALARLDELPESARNASTRIARARIMDRSGQALDAVAEQAQGVLDDAEATNDEKAWARLLLARAAAASGDRVTAREHLDQASEVAPPGDELFTLTLTEAALRMGAVHFAQQAAERLPSPLSTDAGRRAQLSAELALERRDLRGADSALRHAPEGGRTSLARARLLEARGELDEARRLYLAAAEAPAQRVPAIVYLAEMELAQGHAEEAATRVEPLLAEFPNHPDVVPVAVAAQLGLEHADRAEQLIEPALEAHPEDVRLLAARAHVQAALERWEDALATLDSALRIESDDADLHADRGAAAHQLNRREVAREAYDAALALSEGHPVALAGRLKLDVDENRLADARRILERVDAAEIRSLAVERLRARLLVMELAGNAGTRAVRRALTTYDDDPVLGRQLGWLYMQAEEYAQAGRRFTQVPEGDEDPDGALLAKALAQLRMRLANPARALLEGFTEDRDVESLAPELRAELHALWARIAWTDHDRVVATREAQAAVELDRRNSEAHLVLAEILHDRDEDASAEYQASLEGPHPSSRGLALLSIREEAVTAATCEYARRYRRAAPRGQYARGIWRVLRDCRHLDGDAGGADGDDEEPPAGPDDGE
ncbi:MAG: hypothetical protein H6719_22220 [Sandaracinaceae bacterium]|nr:hypothetical protein [Sandaracinaceae bacterium]